MATRTRRTPPPATTGPAQCGACGAPVIRQVVGRVAALTITADTTPIPRADEHRLREPNRLTWCLTTSRWAPTELRWRCTEYTTRCDHQIVIEHRCTTPRRPPADPQQPAAAQPSLF
ncbi:hypothetical protein [Actinacidiphila sp. ITFR-21]|uniref:hypothetical protein n=1 Tax=Actinacidiphila sp. ITFR-21 TaxID=3075199 RepID=UPI00288B43B1|nr:hypothetical protein [Streptomyces sp. ITFR-21]WNI15556.1 hypothetical protein RLT57_08470 [Streptomyces sp. ITFR-21]